jgi:hypothetical protein
MLNERLIGSKEYESLEFETAVYGGPRNFVSRHYVFKGFEDNEEFGDYVKILLDW